MSFLNVHPITHGLEDLANEFRSVVTYEFFRYSHSVEYPFYGSGNF
jgi:hypothetical protein